MSDYDILVVSKKRLGSRTVTVSNRVKSSFLKNKNANTQTRPQIINESIAKFNNALSEGRYFYVDILTEGIVLYDSGECQLATPRELNFLKSCKWRKNITILNSIAEKDLSLYSNCLCR